MDKEVILPVKLRWPFLSISERREVRQDGSEWETTGTLLDSTSAVILRRVGGGIHSRPTGRPLKQSLKSVKWDHLPLLYSRRVHLVEYKWYRDPCVFPFEEVQNGVYLGSYTPKTRDEEVP